MKLKYPQWQEPLAAALLEFNPRELSAKIERAQEAITRRFKELEFERNNNEEELRLLNDGLFILEELGDRFPKFPDSKAQ
jgi:hypothetical protein